MLRFGSWGEWCGAKGREVVKWCGSGWMYGQIDVHVCHIGLLTHTGSHRLQVGPGVHAHGVIMLFQALCGQELSGRYELADVALSLFFESLHHTTYISLTTRITQIYRCLKVPMDPSEVCDMVNRLVEVVAEQGDDMQVGACFCGVFY